MRELLEEFFTHYLRERDLEATLALLTDNIISIGTGEQEIAKNKEELRALTEIEFKELPEPLDFELSNYTETPLGYYGWSVFVNVLAKINTEGITAELFTRFTCVCIDHDGRPCAHRACPRQHEQKREHAKQLFHIAPLPA